MFEFSGVVPHKQKIGSDKILAFWMTSSLANFVELWDAAVGISEPHVAPRFGGSRQLSLGGLVIESNSSNELMGRFTMGLCSTGRAPIRENSLITLCVGFATKCKLHPPTRPGRPRTQKKTDTRPLFQTVPFPTENLI